MIVDGAPASPSGSQASPAAPDGSAPSGAAANALLPCPFCGCGVELVERGKLIVFKCPDSSPCVGGWLATYGATEHRETAIASWNRRNA